MKSKEDFPLRHSQPFSGRRKTNLSPQGCVRTYRSSEGGKRMERGNVTRFRYEDNQADVDMWPVLPQFVTFIILLHHIHDFINVIMNMKATY